MVSAIDVTVPAPNSNIISANVRTNFSTAAGEITTLQNQLTTAQGNITALQTKTTVSGDGSLAANGQLTINAIGGRQWSTTPPTNGQVMQWSGSQWVPTTPSVGVTVPLTLTGDNPLIITGGAGNQGQILYNSVGQAWHAGSNNAGNFVVGNAGGNVVNFHSTGVTNFVSRGVTVSTSATVPADMGPGTINITGGYYVNGTLLTPGGSLTPPVTLSGVDYPLIIGGGAGNEAQINYNSMGQQWHAGNNNAGNFVIGLTPGLPGGNVLNLDHATGRALFPTSGVMVGPGTLANMGVGTINVSGGYYVNGTLLTVGGGGLPATGGTLTGGLTINTTGAGTALGAQTSGNNTLVTVDAAGAGYLSRLQLRRAGGDFTNVPASLQAVGSNYQLGMIELLGWDGAAWGGGGVIQCQVPGGVTWNAGNRPVRMVFQTTRNSSPNPSTAMQIGADGGLIVGNAPGGDQGPGSVNAEKIQSGGDVIVLGNVHIDGELWVGGVKIA